MLLDLIKKNQETLVKETLSNTVANLYNKIVADLGEYSSKTLLTQNKYVVYVKVKDCGENQELQEYVLEGLKRKCEEENTGLTFNYRLVNDNVANNGRKLSIITFNNNNKENKNEPSSQQFFVPAKIAINEHIILQVKIEEVDVSLNKVHGSVKLLKDSQYQILVFIKQIDGYWIKEDHLDGRDFYPKGNCKPNADQDLYLSKWSIEGLRLQREGDMELIACAYTVPLASRITFLTTSILPDLNNKRVYKRDGHLVLNNLPDYTWKQSEPYHLLSKYSYISNDYYEITISWCLK